MQYASLYFNDIMQRLFGLFCSFLSNDAFVIVLCLTPFLNQSGLGTIDKCFFDLLNSCRSC